MRKGPLETGGATVGGIGADAGGLEGVAAAGVADRISVALGVGVALEAAVVTRRSVAVDC